MTSHLPVLHYIYGLKNNRNQIKFQQWSDRLKPDIAPLYNVIEACEAASATIAKLDVGLTDL